MKILAIDTSCDETAAAVTENFNVLSNIIWSQASLHAKFGGVVPSLAQRQHEERIGWVVDQALKKSKCKPIDLDFVAVTVGPGLAIALGVGINKAKELSDKYKLPIIPVNHIEAHLLSPLARANTQIQSRKSKKNYEFPSYGLVVSGGNTLFVRAVKIGKYEILAQTVDDALGEALDKGARILGLGYPGGPILEKFAEEGKNNSYPLPIPMLGQEKKMIFSYSGLKTALYRLVEQENATGLNKEKITNLAATYQNVAFEHIVRVMGYYFKRSGSEFGNLLVGGGVAANVEFRKKIRNLCRKYNLAPLFPYSKKLYTDNAAMIGVCAYLKMKNDKKANTIWEMVERKPDLKL